MKSAFEENEVSQYSNGGTELMKRLLGSRLDPTLLDNFQIIASRVRELDDTKIRIAYFHDLANDTEVLKFKDKQYRSQFHHFVFISDWQYQQFRDYLGFPFDETCSVIEHGYDPISVDWNAKQSAECLKFTYTSTPQRGLNILVPVFAKFSEDKDVHLDVFSSYKIYGWEEMDKQFEPLYEVIRNHPKMTYHGVVSHQELLEYLPTAHVFAYPSTWTETSCRAMEEAMCAGLMCIHPNLGALPDTSGRLTQMYQGHSDQNFHANIFYRELVNGYNALRTNPQVYDYLRYVKNYADNRYNIEKVLAQWNGVLNALVNCYNTPESRQIKDTRMIIDTSAPRW